MEVEKRSSKGGFLQLFDWNAKSRKKLFSNKPDLPESSKQGKENIDKLDRLQQMKLHDGNHGPRLTGNDWASTVGNDEGCGTKAPGVVARLMGLDSLPTLDASDSGFTAFVDTHSFRHSPYPRITPEYENEHFVDYGMRNKLDGFSRNPVEDRLQKLQNRPIERFQSEVLPPRSAKSVPITHHRMLSPIKSPGFVLSRNASCIMEAASKIIEQSPQSIVNHRLPSFGSSVPVRILDLKEKMEAAKRTSRFPEASQRSIMHSPVNSSKSLSRDNRQCLSEVVILKQGVAGSSQPHKNKHVSLTNPVKTNVQKREGATSRSRSTMKEKEDGTKSIQLDKKLRNTPKRLQNGSATGRTPEVLTQNNQKQNCAPNKDRVSLKPRAPYQHERKTFTNVSSREVKGSKKAVENSATGAKKAQLVSSETRKDSTSRTKNISGKKRPTVGDIISDGTNSNNLMIKDKERPVKCNVTIDGSSNWESVDRKNGMDVVSFTFTSPIKKSVPQSETYGQSAVKSQGLSLNFQEDQPESDIGTSGIPSFGTPVIDSDALGVLLEQKLKELSSLVEVSQCDNAKGCSSLTFASVPDCLPGSDVVGSPPTKHDQMFHPKLQKDKSVIQSDSDASLVDQVPVNAKPEWQGVEVTDCNKSTSEINGSERIDECRLPCTSSSPEASLSDVISVTSNSITTGNKHSMSERTMELFAEEIELQDSATSLSNPLFEFISITRWSSEWESEYIREVISYSESVLDNFTFSPHQKVINAELFDQLENQNKTMDPFLRVQRKALFDCVSTCLETRCERAFIGSYKEWAKWSTNFQNIDLLVDDIHKEILDYIAMEEMMVDEVVDKDMSTRDGKWLDFKAEALEEGVVIEIGIMSGLIDEIVADFLPVKCPGFIGPLIYC